MPTYSFELNGRTVTVDAPADLSVLWTLRDKLGVTGPKYGCGIQVCYACTSHVDGEAFNPCVTDVSTIDGKRITTIEGMADGDTLHPVQEAWLEQDVPQCGYCQPGQIMSAAALLATNLEPSDEDIDRIENVCRCGTYFRVREAIKSAALKIQARNAAGAPVAVAPGAAVPVAAAPVAAAPVTAPAVATLPTTGAGQTAAVAGGLVAAAAVAARIARGAAGEDERDSAAPEPA